MGNAPGPLVSIVIVNWNGEKFLLKNLSSIFSQSFTSYEVILVDNGSTDGSVETAAKNFPQVSIIKNSGNLGFAAANNQGIKRAAGEFVLTLNNDTELAPGFLEEFSKAAGASGVDVGMWAVKILSLEEPDVIDSVGGLLIYPDGLGKGRGRLERDRGQYDGADEVFIPSACAGFYRKRMLDSIGLFDEDFFAYCEDTDLGLRARLAGYRTKNVPKAVVYHYYSGTGGRYTPLKAFLVERNRLWVAFKNFPLSSLAASPFYTLWRYAVQAYGIASGKGAGGRFVEDFSRLALFSILMRAYAHALKKLPKMYLKRRQIRKSMKVKGRAVKNWFSEYGLGAKELVLKD